MKKILASFLFCLLFTGGIAIGDGYVIKKSLTAGEEGIDVTTIPMTACGPNVVCDGGSVIHVDPLGRIELCWTSGSDRCASGPIDAPLTGTHYYTIQGFVDDKVVTYDRWDDATQSYIPTSYTLPGSKTPVSNEAVLIVAGPGVMPPLPDPPTGCSVTRLLQ